MDTEHHKRLIEALTALTQVRGVVDAVIALRLTPYPTAAVRVLSDLTKAGDAIAAVLTAEWEVTLPPD